MRLNLALSTLKENEFYSRDYEKRIHEIHEMLHSGDHSAGTTWVDYPLTYDKKEFLKAGAVVKYFATASVHLIEIRNLRMDGLTKVRFL